MSAVIPATVMVVVGTTELTRLAKGDAPTVKPLIAGFILGIGLYSVTGIDSHLGALFCILLITGSLLINGPAVFKLAGGFVS